MESQPQNPEFRISPENFRKYNCHEQTLVFKLCRYSLFQNNPSEDYLNTETHGPSISFSYNDL